MPATFPTLSSGSGSIRYPLSRSKTYVTGLHRFGNGSEQRWKSVGALQRPLEIQLRGLDGYNLSLVREFFRSMKGAFDSTWSITLGAATYPNCAFDQDDFSPVERKPNLYDLTLRIVQTHS
jgi:hypothetical protein